MSDEKRAELEQMLANTPRDVQAIGLVLLQIAVELDRIAETQEEAHK